MISQCIVSLRGMLNNIICILVILLIYKGSLVVLLFCLYIFLCLSCNSNFTCSLNRAELLHLFLHSLFLLPLHSYACSLVFALFITVLCIFFFIDNLIKHLKCEKYFGHRKMEIDFGLLVHL